ncbi:MAG: sialate O-acetylesterase [Candidatus Marinimicrobia bacterium]|nr:sialate O-acetylesterase [Candidatus Neomarinimicrobiota bacterium]
MRRIQTGYILLLALVGWGGAPVRAAVRLPALFGEHMVLQRGGPVPVWGWAAPGEPVRITLGTAAAATVADAAGRWRVQLPEIPAGGPYELTVAGENTITLRNVMVGEVWLCAGQSNMKGALKGVAGGAEAAAAAEGTDIRLFSVATVVASAPLEDVTGSWAVAGPRSAGSFSAVGWFFGEALQRSLDVPLGLILCAEGATRAEFWVGAETLESDPDFQWVVRRWEAYAAEQKLFEQFPDLLAQMTTLYREGRLERKIYKHVPSGLYYGMLRPLTTFPLRGVIWYQGESNAGRAHVYRKLLPALIAEWRRDWGRELPFLIVQLPQIATWPDFAELREAQLLTARTVQRTGLAVTFDVGDPAEVHPRNKRPFGERLARLARAMVYGEDLESSGPLLSEWQREGAAIRLRFTHAAGGLVARDGQPLAGFVMAGADRVFHPAQALIEGDTVIVRSAQVAEPVTVRYAWADNPPCSLYNQAGLPASPFRLDDWPGVTERDIAEARTDPVQMAYLVDYYLNLNLPAQARGCLDAWQGDDAFRDAQIEKFNAAAGDNRPD